MFDFGRKIGVLGGVLRSPVTRPRFLQHCRAEGGLGAAAGLMCCGQYRHQPDLKRGMALRALLVRGAEGRGLVPASLVEAIHGQLIRGLTSPSLFDGAIDVLGQGLGDVLLRFSFAEAALAYDRRPQERHGVIEGASGWAEGVGAVGLRSSLLPSPGPGFVWPAAWAEWVAALKGAGFNTRIMEM